MRSYVLLAIALSLLAATPVGASPSAVSETVASVSDGDTMRLRNGERVRLLQVDAPEAGECYGHVSRALLFVLAPVGSRVTLEPDAALDSVDRFGRLLRYVRRGGVNVNLELVRRGAAAPYFFAGERGRYASRLVATARAARAARRGLWRACPGTPLDPNRQLDTRRGLWPPVAPIAGGGCDPNYANACVPRYPPDLDCDDLRDRGLAPVRVVGDDPHGFDGDGDGWGCE